MLNGTQGRGYTAARDTLALPWPINPTLSLHQQGRAPWAGGEWEGAKGTRAGQWGTPAHGRY